ncbi:MAG: hypothetical protein P8N08_01065 [Flavobacteriaceae bacterium]|nr:hypothetical protein [Flavobacteriaceae bacterium]
MKYLFSKTLMLMGLILLSSCGMSKLISVDRGENTINYYNSIDNTIILDFGDLTSISEDKKYGNLEIKVDEITKDVADNGAVMAYIQRPASEGKIERWSQFPQYSLIYENPSFTYLSFGEGFVRISLQSETTVESAAEFFKGKKIKLVILK